ncbi:amidophosphoribosyltransferase [Desulforamulus hydrothermalis]|uniref:Amidophosphoribosyltransferase n=1 Tax=Desulforamulus hydrothermalis Lam5 = DSM 18033 TaxID=1121428 RepID=K8EBZ6_9FIRM|nr:amidophosphoribosyltransferase [Desulforamulus hydrothermalis]CCO09228.1 Amidophosphoribosyltransferase [Desulforamulus hydrothermalis Lam5 = DSM 18033]SHH06079.1 amidophosphoribosyltransferase [Desulforamulus hydrothermalis Lam5 = DSM 18033]
MSNEVANLLLPDKPVEECGVFGIYGAGLDVARLTYYGLHALQHRGQESAGIAVADGRQIQLHKGMGLVTEVFTGQQLEQFCGPAAIGHVRYSTTGASQPLNAQPLVFRYAKGMLGLAHNGNITNITELRAQLAATGSVFQSSTDSEVVVNLIARYNANSLEEALMKCMIDVKGAYSLLILTENALYAARDPHGFRPLCLGRLGDAYVVASESCALTTVGAAFLRDIEPGEIIRIDQSGLTVTRGLTAQQPAHCIFEYIYFARPDSTLDGFNVNLVRREMGRQLAREYPVAADIVIAVPDSGTAAARGYAEESGIPFEEGLMKNRYVGRTFIQPTQAMREIGVKLKLNPIREVLQDKRVVMVDDSIVRGTTSQKLVAMLRQAGAREVHLCISSPPVRRSCYYGIDTSDEQELIAAKLPLEEIRRNIDADGLHYLSLEGLLDIFAPRQNHFCTACFNGHYPVEVAKPKESGKYSLE